MRNPNLRDKLLANGEVEVMSKDEASGTTVYQVKDDAQHLTYTITETITDLTGKPSNDIILAWLGEGFKENAEGKIVKVEGTSEYEVNFTTTPDGKTVVRTMTVTNAHGAAGTVDTDKPVDADMTTDTEVDAVIAAVGEAIAADKLTADDITETKVDVDDETGVYTVTVTATVNGVEKEYTYKVTASTSSDTKDWTVEECVKKDVYSGSTTTITGSAQVEGETIVWGGTETDEKVTVTVDEETKEVSFNVKDAEVGKEFDKTTGEKVTKVYEENGKKVVETKYVVVTGKTAEGKDITETHTKTYKFSLGTMDETEIAKFMKDNGLTGDGNAKLTGLSKVTWTIDETVVTTTPGKDEVKTPDGSMNGEDSQIVTGNTGAVKDEANDTYSYNGVTLTKGTDGKWQGTSADGKTTYVIEETTKDLSENEIRALIEKSETNPNGYEVPEGFTFTEIKDGNKAIYTEAATGKTITVNFTAPTKTEVKLTTTVTDQFESTTSEADLKKQIADWVKAQVDTGKTVKIGAVEFTKEMTVDQIIEKLPSIAINHTVDFTQMSEAEIQKMLEDLEKQSTNNYVPTAPGSTYGQYVYSGKTYNQWGNEDDRGNVKKFYGVTYIKENGKWYQAELKTGTHHFGTYTYYGAKADSPAYEEDAQHFINIPIPEQYLGKFNTELGHVDLVADATLTDSEGKSHDCVLLDDVTITLNKTAQGMAYGQGNDDDAKLADSISWDDQDGVLKDENGNPIGYWQYNRGSGLSQDYVDRANKFYKVTGTVAYDLKSFDSEDAAKRAKDNNEIIGYVKVPKVENNQVVKDGKHTVYVYKGYAKTAILTTYGYLGAENNACHNDYDIKLGNLNLMEGGEKVTSINKEVDVYSAQVTATSTLTSAINKLIFGDIVTTTPGTEDSTSTVTNKDNGNALAGAWTITQTRTESDLKEKSGSSESSWKYSDKKETSYDTWRNWAETKATFGSSSTRYEGSLGYDYTITGRTDVGGIVADASSITRSAETVRNVAASLSNTTVTTTQGSTTTTTTTPAPAPVTPTPVTPTDDDDDDPTPPTVIDEEDVPLAETPETPVVEIPDEEVPMAEEPEVEIPDEEVPLADVPGTGDNFLLEALALAISSASGLWLGLGKKRRS